MSFRSNVQCKQSFYFRREGTLSELEGDGSSSIEHEVKPAVLPGHGVALAEVVRPGVQVRHGKFCNQIAPAPPLLSRFEADKNCPMINDAPLPGDSHADQATT